MYVYVCSLPNKKGDGIPRHLFAPEGDGRIAEFIKREEGPGRGIFYCIGLLRPGATERNKETVAALPSVVLDLDLKNITEPREAVLACLRNLLLPPSEIRDSGNGLHAIWILKEPMTDAAGMEQTEAVMKRLVTLLAGDPLPTHRAALLRCVGSHNSKDNAWKECAVIERSDARYDIFEFQDMFDLYGDRAQLHYKLKTNGHDSEWADSSEGARHSTDIEAMRYQGTPGMNEVFLAHMGSSLSKGDTVAETIERIVEAAERNCATDPNRPRWRHDLAEKATWWIEKHPEWIYTALSRELAQAWRNAQGKKRRSLIWKNGRGLEVRSWGDNGAASLGMVTDGNVVRLESAQKRPQEQRKIGPRPFSRIDEKTLPRRQWFYGRHYMRKITTATVAPGGTGKSNLSLVEAISMALGRDLIYGEAIGRHRVWYHNAEDPQDEIDRRVVAACKFYKIDQGELEGWLFTTSGLNMPIKIATGNGELKIEKSTVRQVVDGIEDNEIDVVIFDPLIAMHTTGESDNVKMRQVIDTFSAVANSAECSIEMVHHVRKLFPGQEHHTTSDSRGASAIIDAVRSARVLNAMTKQEAEAMDVDDEERLRHVRLDRGKANMVAAGVASWLKFESVELDNGDEDNPGDNVGVITRWDPPNLHILMSAADKTAIQNAVADARCREDIRSPDWVGIKIATRCGLDHKNLRDRERLKIAIRDLMKEGALAKEELADKKGELRTYVVPGAKQYL